MKKPYRLELMYEAYFSVCIDDEEDEIGKIDWSNVEDYYVKWNELHVKTNGEWKSYEIDIGEERIDYRNPSKSKLTDEDYNEIQLEN
tara:strand:+ start:2270 stop:2530 length:261 start_codon:yes stop_codon:yes gene_type:complete